MTACRRMAWTFRGVALLGAIVFVYQHNWGALCWVVVALLQHERAEMRGAPS